MWADMWLAIFDLLRGSPRKTPYHGTIKTNQYTSPSFNTQQQWPPPHSHTAYTIIVLEEQCLLLHSYVRVIPAPTTPTALGRCQLLICWCFRLPCFYETTPTTTWYKPSVCFFFFFFGRTRYIMLFLRQLLFLTCIWAIRPSKKRRLVLLSYPLIGAIDYLPFSLGEKFTSFSTLLCVTQS